MAAAICRTRSAGYRSPRRVAIAGQAESGSRPQNAAGEKCGGRERSCGHRVYARPRKLCVYVSFQGYPKERTLGLLKATAPHFRFCTRLVGLWSRPRTEMASRSHQGGPGGRQARGTRLGATSQNFGQTFAVRQIFTSSQTAPISQSPVTVSVALEGSQQLVHLGLGQVLPDPVGIVPPASL
jgi:hypothetical protein